MRAFAAIALAASLITATACGPRSAAPGAEPERPAKLPPPAPLDAARPGASYLTLLAAQLQPAWSSFLEDCRFRLPPDHPLNAPVLHAVATLAIDRSGTLALAELRSSGNADFDRAVRGVVADARRVDAPPDALLGDDDRVTVEWLFARDRRQAGPATAKLVPRRLPIDDVIRAQVARGELSRAARRIASELGTGEPPMRAVHALMSGVLVANVARGAGRVLAIEAAGRARLTSAAPHLRTLLGPSTDTQVRIAATKALAMIGDAAAVGPLLALLPSDLRSYPRVAVHSVEALVRLGAQAQAAKLVREAITASAVAPKTQPALFALLPVHALAPSPELDASLVAWFASVDPRMRAAVCAAIPPTRTAKLVDLLRRGVRDGNATVRAECLDAVGRQAPQTIRSTILVERCTDRDVEVRARAIALLAAVDPRRAAVTRCVASSFTDPAPEIRVAGVRAMDPATLRASLADPDPDVRAAAVRELARTDEPVANDLLRWSADPAPQVRLAIVETATAAPIAAAFIADDDPIVATAALVAQVAAAKLDPALLRSHLAQLADEPAGSPERIRIALAWLLVLPP